MSRLLGVYEEKGVGPLPLFLLFPHSFPPSTELSWTRVSSVFSTLILCTLQLKARYFLSAVFSMRT